MQMRTVLFIGVVVGVLGVLVGLLISPVLNVTAQANLAGSSLVTPEAVVPEMIDGLPVTRMDPAQAVQNASAAVGDYILSHLHRL